MPSDDAQPEPSATPFERAVAREREAIDRHLEAALLEDAAAEANETRALTEPDKDRRAELRARAAADRERASHARARAEAARARLLAEGEETS